MGFRFGGDEERRGPGVVKGWKLNGGLLYQVMCPTRPQRTPILSHVSNRTSEDSRTKSCVQPDLKNSRTKSCIQPDLRGLP
ncbi:hypothetical protein Pmani_024721 [Petrolisthes manimaculis]|uniref:Uncharacterized protein n=1 Tax=Petrolisthes manimaculis TaxID=1843537 RepID=A0AAE1P7W7_9EUCA|nr:hypothetical protein Pmani_024721 [Petrolisthes manimaculis]